MPFSPETLFSEALSFSIPWSLVTGGLTVLPIPVGRTAKVSIGFSFGIFLWDPQLTGAFLSHHNLLSGIFLGWIFGFLICLPIATAMQIFSHLSEYLDLGRGQSLGQVMNPLMNTQEGTLGVILQFLILALLVEGGICHLMLKYLLLAQQILCGGIPEIGQKTPFFPTLYHGALFIFKTISPGEIALNALKISGILYIPMGIAYVAAELVGVLTAKIMPSIHFTTQIYILKSTVAAVFLWFALDLRGDTNVPIKIIHSVLAHYGAGNG